jgi:RND family efflux transporter MFP subunit
MKRVVIYISIIVLAVAVAFLALQLVKKEGQRGSLREEEELTIPVVVSPVVSQEFRDEISTVSTLTARETSPLSPEVPGNVEAVLVDIGDPVKAGQALIRLERTNFQLAVNQARAAYAGTEAVIAQAEAQFDQVQKEYRRASNLLTEKVIPQTRFDAADAAYKAAREALAAVKEQRNQARAALETAQEHLADAVIRSPIEGVVVDRHVEVGQAVAPGMPVLRIVDQSSLRADVGLPEIDFTRVAKGTYATVEVDAFPGEEFPAKVTVINPMVDRQTRTFRVRIKVPNPTGKLVDGMFARVRLSMGNRTALAIPRDALSRLPGSGTCYVFVVEGNRATKRPVKIGTSGDRYIEILDGVVEGDTVVTSGTGRLRSGVKVAISGDQTQENQITR